MEKFDFFTKPSTFPFDHIPQTLPPFVTGIEGDFNNETAGKINVDNQGHLR
jgi:hypothetical protein